jgi:DNA-binding NarL/FixJ family response regulator
MMPLSSTEPRDQGIQGKNPIRVVIGEDTFLMREALERIVSGFDYIDAVAFCGDRDSLVAAIEEERPDAVLTDIRMPPTGTDEGIRAARQIRADHPDTGVVVLSQYADEAYVYDLLKDGAAGLGYLLKERVADLDEVVRALQEVSRGGSVLDPKVVESLVAAKDRLAHSPLAQLTDREREVLSLMAQGMNNASIAKTLFLTDRAVEKHINSMFHKLGLTEEPDVHRRVMAVLAFLRETELA